MKTLGVACPDLRSHHAPQLVVLGHHYAQHLARAQRRAGGYAEPTTADLGPSRPARPVVHVGIKHAVVGSEHAADQFTRGLRGAVGIGVHPRSETGDTGIDAPVSRHPSASVEKAAINL